MAKAHFITMTVEGVMFTICGETIAPKQITGAHVGVYGERCKKCEDKVKLAWVTFP
jgi:hypothetical protein